MNEMDTVDARGLDCPQPVILARKAIETCPQVRVMVDNDIAVENIRRMAAKVGCRFEVEEKENRLYQIMLYRTEGQNATIVPGDQPACVPDADKSGPLVVVFSENTMGRGNSELGLVLVRAFIHTLGERPRLPDMMIFYNTGVFLTVRDSAALEDLKTMADAGVEILVCGTCANFFNIKEDIAVGVVSNMYDIAEAMCGAVRLIMP